MDAEKIFQIVVAAIGCAHRQFSCRIIELLILLLAFSGFGVAANAEYLPLDEDVVLGDQVEIPQGQLGHDAQAAIDKYWDSIYDPDPKVRESALAALGDIAIDGDAELQAFLGNYHAEFRDGTGGVMLPDGETAPGPEINYKKALKWLQLAHKNGARYVANNIASLYYAGSGIFIPPNYEEARKWYEIALAEAVSNDSKTQPAFNLGVIYELGLGVENDNLKAVSLYEIGARRGYRRALWQLGLLYESGGGNLSPDAVRALEMFSKAAAGGHEEANLHLISSYPEHSGLPIDVLYQQGQDQRALTLATFYYEQGVSGASQRYIDYERARAKSDPVARELLAERFLYGDIVEFNAKKALEMASIEGPSNNDNDCQILFINGVLLSAWPNSADEIDRIFEQGREEDNGYCLATLAFVAVSADVEDFEDVEDYGDAVDAAVSSLIAALYSDESFAKTYSYQTLLKLADSGESPYAMYRLARELIYAEVMEQDIDTALHYLRSAKRAGLAEAAELLQELELQSVVPVVTSADYFGSTVEELLSADRLELVKQGYLRCTALLWLLHSQALRDDVYQESPEAEDRIFALGYMAFLYNDRSYAEGLEEQQLSDAVYAYIPTSEPYMVTYGDWINEESLTQSTLELGDHPFTSEHGTCEATAARVVAGFSSQPN
ncbi:sel1 repeat family protein [Luminiphilus sp.]|nr:sel1 repeat family protein [Luminiphilus sp.]